MAVLATNAAFERELQYGCSVDRGRVSSSTVAASVQWLVGSMSNINNANGDALESKQSTAGHIARAHSLLRGSVDLG